MPDLENISIAIGILLVSCIQAEIYVNPYSLPVSGRHLRFLTYPDTRQYSDQSSRVVWHRKRRYSRWNCVVIPHMSWDICYSIFTSGYRPPSLIYYSPWRRRVFALALPCFCTSIWRFPLKFADISFVSWYPSKPPFWIVVGVAYNLTAPKAPQEMCSGSPTSR